MAGHQKSGLAESRSTSRDLPLTEAKFRPPAVLLDAVVRRRLLRLLSQGADRPLTLLSAPAGYGKTVLVASWAPATELSSTLVHMRMDDGDESTQGFLTSVVEGLRRGGVDVSGVQKTASSRPAGGALLTRLADRIAAHDEPVVWVLDCGECSLSPALGDTISRLIDRCGPSLRVVLLTRSDPPLPLHRYRLTDAVTEIRAADLAFTATEASWLMRRAGLALDPVDLSALQERTGGWPAGLKFAARSLAGRADTAEAIREFRGDTGNVAAYLMAEVLATQPLDTREFLLRTCVADELDPGLVGALTGLHCDPRALEFMAHGNSFIEPVPGVRSRYRYSSLFREFLRSQLSFERPALVPELHRTAAEWLVAHGQRLAAIRHAVSAQAWPAAARYLVDGNWLGHLLIGDQRAVLTDVFSGLPADTEGVDAALTRAAMALTDLDAGRGTRELDTARTLLEEQEPARKAACTPKILVLEALVASLGADLGAALDAALVAEKALQLAPSDVSAIAELRVLVDGCLARVLFQRGDFPAALAALEHGIKAAEGSQLEEASSELQGMRALVEGASGRLRRATRLAFRSGPQEDPTGDPASPAAILALAWVRVDEYDLQAAQDLLVAYAETAAHSYDAGILGMVHALLRARLLGPRGEFELARAGLRAARVPSVAGEANGWLDGSLVVAQASSFLAQDRPEEAITTIRDCEGCDEIESTLLLEQAAVARGESASPKPRAPTPGETSTLAVQVRSWLTRAGRSLMEEDLADGEACVERALHLAAREHLRRPFHEAPEEVRRLLERGSLRSRSRWLDTTCSAPGDDTRGGPGEPAGHADHSGRRQVDPVLNPLTVKEREVLGHLAELLTTEEVAATMFVSVNTVRSHVRSILRKLGVTKRNDAVRRAWDLGLLPPRNAA